MIRNATDALDQLADGLWWLKGFAAARTPEQDSSAGEHLTIAGQVQETRAWLQDLLGGRNRVLEPGRIGSANVPPRVYTERADGGLIVITYAEYERILDGLQNTPTPADQDDALRVLRSIFEEWTRQVDVINARPDIF